VEYKKILLSPGEGGKKTRGRKTEKQREIGLPQMPPWQKDGHNFEVRGKVGTTEGKNSLYYQENARAFKKNKWY